MCIVAETEHVDRESTHSEVNQRKSREWGKRTNNLRLGKADFESLFYDVVLKQIGEYSWANDFYLYETLTKSMDSRALDLIRKVKAKKRSTTNLAVPLLDDFEAVYPSKDQVEDSVVNRLYLNQIMSDPSLTKQERKIIDQRLIGVTDREIAKRYRVNPRTIGRSRKMIAKNLAWLRQQRSRTLSKSLLGEAIGYSLNQWDKLTAFLLDGRLEIDNNRSERSIKPFVIGRKNWLFANTPRGAKASAAIYSVIETAKENGLNPFKYLMYLFEQLPQLTDPGDTDALDRLMPWSASLPLTCRVFKS